MHIVRITDWYYVEDKLIVVLYQARSAELPTPRLQGPGRLHLGVPPFAVATDEDCVRLIQAKYRNADVAIDREPDRTPERG